MCKKVTVHTSYWGHDGRHVFITIIGNGMKFTGVAGRGTYQAKIIIESILQEYFEGYEIVRQGDVIVPYFYTREGD